MTQAEVTTRAKQLFPKLVRHAGLLQHRIRKPVHLPTAGVVSPGPRLGGAHEVFQRHALALLETVAVDAIADAGLTLDDIDAIVVNTITGLAIPSLDAMLMNRLQLKPSAERLPIFGLGCGWCCRTLSRIANGAGASRAATCCFSPSISAVCVSVRPMTAWRCSLRPLCLAMAPPPPFCAARRERARAALG